MFSLRLRRSQFWESRSTNGGFGETVSVRFEPILTGAALRSDVGQMQEADIAKTQLYSVKRPRRTVVEVKTLSLILGMGSRY